MVEALSMVKVLVPVTVNLFVTVFNAKLQPAPNKAVNWEAKVELL